MATAKHYDKELDVNFELEVFKVNDTDELLIKYREPISWAIYNALDVMLGYGFDRCPVFIANDIVFEIKKNSADELIQKCLEFFIDSEEYEACADLKEMIDELKAGE